MFTCAVTPCRPGQMLTYPITSETRRCTKLPSLGERYVQARFSALACFAFVSFSCHSSAESIIQPRIDQEVVMLLLRYDACATIINGTAQIPKDVTQNPEIRTMLEGERYMSRRSFIGLFGSLSHVCVSSLTLAWCIDLKVCAFIVLLNTSGRENRRKETGGGTSGGCAGRRPFNVEPAG